MLSSAYAQQAEGEGTSDEEPSDTQTSDEEPSDTQTSDEEPPVSESEALINLQTLVGLAGVNTPQELQELAAADSPNELAQMAGTSDSQELAAEPGITDSQALNAIAEAPNLQGFAELIGMSIPEMLRTLFPPSTPPVEEPPVEEPPTGDLITVEIGSNATSGVAPATIEFTATATGGTEEYEYAWDFGDGSEVSDEQNPVYTFDEAGTYNVTLTVTDADQNEASDSLEVTVTEPPVQEPPTGEEDTTAPTVIGTEPTDGATDVAVNTTAITATFSEAVQGVDDSTFTVDGITGEVTYDTTSNTTTFTPSSDLEPETTYTASLSSAITDAAGNPLEPTEWSFTTAAEGVEEVPPGGTDPWGIDELYATASNGPTWYILEQEDPTDDGHFYLSMYSGTTIDYSGSGVWNVDATSGTQEHGIRMHVDSPTGTWTNTEMTGYFRAVSGSDQFTMIARHGPSYHDDGGCHAYGYYGMTAIDGNVFFKKKLYHFNDGYTKRLAQVNELDNLEDGRWIGMKFVVYDLSNGDVKLELWIDEGDMTNNWRKVTELVDSQNHPVAGGDDCGRDATDS
ncbi:MAG: Ig-like domain-containing protein, partial [Thermoproteota archaeon]|nr:Ig-like domain-containing protein [Thermoproteota archaeon]